MYKPWYSRLYIKSPIVKLLIGILAVGAGIVLLLVLGVTEPARMEAQTGNWEGRSIEKGADIYKNNCAECHGFNGEGVTGPALNSRYFFSQRIVDLGFTGTLEDYVRLTVAAGRPSKVSNQWNNIMSTWGAEYGGPLRQDQVDNVSSYVMNWQTTAMMQTQEEDPWIPFEDTPSLATPEEIYGDGEAVESDPFAARSPEVLFQALACAGCHNMELPQTDDIRGPVGPNMGNIAENAAIRVVGLTAEEYVYNSIIHPNDYIVDGYFANVMTQNYVDQMTEEEIQGMVAWLLDPNR